MKNLTYLISATCLILCLCLLNCESNDSKGGSPKTNLERSDATGKSGSLARFTILEDYLYTVDYTKLNVFNIKDKDKPVLVNTVNLGFDIETLFAYKEYLYIGSRNGMFIYSAAKREEPKFLASVSHFTACDPVIANETHAYVTLKGGGPCGALENVLQVYDIKNIKSPVLISQRNLVHPVGMAFYQNYLFVCDDEVKIFDITQPDNLKFVTAIDQETFDVIVHNDLLILIGKNGLYQYTLNPQNIKDIKKLSTLSL